MDIFAELGDNGVSGCSQVVGASYHDYGSSGKCDRHIETNTQSPGIGGPEKTPLKMSGTMCFVGYSRNQILQRRFYLNVSKVNTPGVSLMANSEHCNDEFDNGE